ncbi:MAG: hypothetical protein WD472_08140 [Dehalococcoidia bacterium]
MSAILTRGNLTVRTGAEVVGYDGVSVGQLLWADQESLQVRLSDGNEVHLKSVAVLDANEHRVRLICYARGVNRWLVQAD